jgi:hypothetical protein
MNSGSAATREGEEKSATGFFEFFFRWEVENEQRVVVVVVFPFFLTSFVSFFCYSAT